MTNSTHAHACRDCARVIYCTWIGLLAEVPVFLLGFSRHELYWHNTIVTTVLRMYIFPLTRTKKVGEFV
jgi:hypothetical protein